MKIHIDNRTNLSLRTIALMFEQWKESSFGETCYVGKKWFINFDNYEMKVELKKTCTYILVTKI